MESGTTPLLICLKKKNQAHSLPFKKISIYFYFQTKKNSDDGNLDLDFAPSPEYSPAFSDV